MENMRDPRDLSVLLRFFLPARTGVRLQVTTNKLNKYYYIIENKNKFNTCK